MSPDAADTKALRFAKAARLALQPAYWSALRKGVAATAEHTPVDFRDDVRTVIDVGASRGQFATFALHRFPAASILCFEPLPEAQAALRRVASSDRTTIYPLALGNDQTELDLHVSALHDSSSLLPIGKGQVDAFPGTGEKRRERVRVALLKDFLHAGLPRPTLLKIDVQGFELAVLKGAERSLDLVDEIFVECSFVELYTGQPLAATVICHLWDAGFRLAGTYGLTTTRGGACLQADFLFKRTCRLR